MSLRLVEYSSSSEDENENTPSEMSTLQNQNLKLKRNNLPNPFKKENDVEESPSIDHNGKVRMFEHERGIWASYVYIHCPTTESIQSLQSSIIDLINTNNSIEPFELHFMDELHMSLTRTVILRHHWINEFTKSIQNSFKNIQRFSIPLNSVRIYCNDNQTRTFISLSINENHTNIQHNLCDIVKRLDECLNEFNLPPFYQDASFHVSILWCAGNKKDALESFQPQFMQHLNQLIALDPSEFNLIVHQLNAKIGNKMFNFCCQ